jgi:hypothetical protein
MFKDTIEANKQEAMVELELCDTLEKCNDWKIKYLGKDSVIGRVIKALGEWKV